VRRAPPRLDQFFLHRPGGSGVSDPRLQKTRIRNGHAAAKPPLSLGTSAPGSTLGPQATSLKTRIRNRFYTSGPQLKIRSERRSGPRPGSATHGYRRPAYETTTRRPSRRCSRVRWPRFPHLAVRPHPSRQWLRNRFYTSSPRLKIRSERRSVPRPGSATHGYRRPAYETATRRPSRHCSRVRWPRFPHLTVRPHPSRQWLRNRFYTSSPQLKIRSEKRSAPRPGSATHGYRRPAYETTTRRPSRHCRWGRRPRVSHLAVRPHPSNQRCARADSNPAGSNPPKRRSVRRSMRRSFRTRVSFSGSIPRVCTLGWYEIPLQGMGFRTR
jgi:hypothetical protein